MAALYALIQSPLLNDVDPNLDSFVERARRAVAINERREHLPPVSFGDISSLNEPADFTNDDTNARYQEQ